MTERERITMRRKLVPKLEGTWVRYERLMPYTQFLHTDKWYIKEKVGRWATEIRLSEKPADRKQFGWTTKVFVREGTELYDLTAKAKKARVKSHKCFSDLRIGDSFFMDLGSTILYRKTSRLSAVYAIGRGLHTVDMGQDDPIFDPITEAEEL